MISISNQCIGQGKCLIVSDIHFNPFYSTFNNCIVAIDTQLVRILGKQPVARWGAILDQYYAGKKEIDLGRHDTNYPLLQSSIQSMKRHEKDISFIVIAGDFIWHESHDPKSPDTIIRKCILKLKTMQFIAKVFRDSFPDVPVIPALGNNDSDRGDYAEQSSVFLKGFAGAWNLNEKIDTALFNKEGYYSYKTVKYHDLKLIVLNSRLISYGTKDSSYYDKGEIMLHDWLKNELTDTTKNVWVISLMPAGQNGYALLNKKSYVEMWNPEQSQGFGNTVIKLYMERHYHHNHYLYYKPLLPHSMRRLVSVCLSG